MGDLIGVASALGAALCWTVASALWRRLPTSLGPARLNLLKNLLALGFQLPLVLVLTLSGRQLPAPPGAVVLLLLSGVVGIALGDSFFFAALRRLGTRRTLTSRVIRSSRSTAGRPRGPCVTSRTLPRSRMG